MTVISDLDEFLSGDEDQYWASDLFLDVETLIQTLTPIDVAQILELWKERELSWRDRFVRGSSSIQQPTLQALLTALLAMPADPPHILSLMTRLRLQNTAEQSALQTSLVVFALSVWQSTPGLRRQVHMCAWSCGLSGQLRRALGFESWGEAGL